ncbi:MAG: FAD-binding oxidoreductase [Planctomycetota bacterium]
MRAKVLIIGGGVMGTSIALHTARSFDPLKEPVVVLERGDLAGGSSGSSGGILRQHYADPVVASMARDSLREYASFEGRTGRALGFRRPGVLTLAGPSNPGSVERLLRSVEAQKQIGIHAEMLDAAAIRSRVPGIVVDDRAIAAWEAQGGYVDSSLCVREFAALARTYGAVTRLGVAITDLVMENGRVVGAETTEGRYECDAIVVVTGAWARSFLGRFGVDVPIRVARVQQLFVGMPLEEDDTESRTEIEGWSVDLEDPFEQEQERLLTGSDEEQAPGAEHPVVLDLEYGIYVRCELEHKRTRVAPIAYSPDQIRDEPDPEDRPRPELSEWARAQLVKRLPIYADQPVLDQMVSWFPLTKDGRALIGEVPGYEGLYVAGGFADHGFKLAPSVGEGVAQMLTGEPVSAFDPGYFAPDRSAAAGDWSGDSYL